jgi:hypothetical protein
MDEEENADIAAAMGFASFGGTKKRKFDHTHSPKAKPDTSGANSTKLGVRTKKVISVEEKDIDGLATYPANQPTQAQSHSPAQPKNDLKPAVSSGLADFLNRGQNLPDKPPGTVDVWKLPGQSDQSATGMLSFGGPPISRAELNALRNGVQNEAGDTAYFLPSFVEDPWEKLRNSGCV